MVMPRVSFGSPFRSGLTQQNQPHQPFPQEPFPGYETTVLSGARDLRAANEALVEAEQRLVSHSKSSWISWSPGGRLIYKENEEGKLVLTKTTSKEMWQEKQDILLADDLLFF